MRCLLNSQQGMPTVSGFPSYFLTVFFPLRPSGEGPHVAGLSKLCTQGKGPGQGWSSPSSHRDCVCLGDQGILTV